MSGGFFAALCCAGTKKKQPDLKFRPPRQSSEIQALALKLKQFAGSPSQLCKLSLTDSR